ncbi:MAG: glycosyl transferase family 1 [Acidimicrobiales bacterium]|nr:glycosyl transferase family 1 [Acidimicrobiales bacterium]
MHPQLRIGLLAPPWIPVPPPVYGGIELAVDLLARELTALGHLVTLFATADSTCPVERRWLHPVALGTTVNLLDELAHVERAYDELADVDVIHDHSLLGPLWSTTRSTGPPVVATVHGELSPSLVHLLERICEEVDVVAISRHQAATAPPVRFRAVIHHGIDVERAPFGSGGGGYVLFLGRMHPNKGAHRAVAVARRAGRPILLAAKMWEPHEHRYYREVVEPMLGPDAVYVGEVGAEEKQRLLAGAAALVNPIRWPEPFGLVMIESLAAGTPVITFPEGAAAEIVDHGRTGFLCRDEAEMVDAVLLVDHLDRSACRREAASRFSVRRMADDHVALYRQVLSRRRTGGPRNVTSPTGPPPSTLDASGVATPA